MNLSEIAEEMAKQNPHIKPIENKEPFTQTFISQAKSAFEPSQKRSEIGTELAQTWQTDENGALVVPSWDYVIKTAEKLGYRRIPPIHSETTVQNEFQNKGNEGQ